MHGLVERQGLEQKCSCQEGPESLEAGSTFGFRLPGGETGLVCERPEGECGRVSGTLWTAISGQSHPDTMPMLMYSESLAPSGQDIFAFPPRSQKPWGFAVGAILD